MIERKIGKKNELRDILKTFVERYIPVAKDSIRLNSHMNRLSHETSETKITEVLADFLDGFIPPDGSKVIDLLTNLTNMAKERNYAAEEERAIVVDFINYVGMSYGVDYALYTTDICTISWI